MKTTPQRLSTNVLQVVRAMRRRASEGRLVREEWDHGNPSYESGYSNKQVIIAAAVVLGRDPIDFDEAWDVMAELAFGAVVK